MKKHMNHNTILRVASVLAFILFGCVASQATGTGRVHYDIAYGDHPRQMLDIYTPASAGPHPFIIYIHGGGWWSGDKANSSDEAIEAFNNAGIAYVAINYRSLVDAEKTSIFPPVMASLMDAKRALQFLRLHAEEFKLDAKNVAVSGASAGGFNALWLGLTPDQADLGSDDPVERQSTHVTIIGVMDAQTSIDPKQMRAWVGPALKYGGHAFGLPEPQFEMFLERRAEFKKYFSRISPAELMRADAPPVHLFYSHLKPMGSREHIDYVHSPQFGLGFLRLAIERRQQTTLWFAGPIGPGKRAAVDFRQALIDHLLRTKGKSR